MSRVRDILSGIHWTIRNTANILRRGKIFSSRRTKNFVYLDLHSNPYDRYLYLLLFVLEANKVDVVIRYRLGFVSKWASSLAIRENKNCYFTRKRPNGALATITNLSRQSTSFDFSLSHDFFDDHANAWYLPMPMVDTFYVDNIYQQASNFQQNTDRNIRIFFAGRFLVSSYSRNELRDFFHTYNRRELLTIIQDNFTLETLLPTDLDILENDLTDRIVIVDRDVVNVDPHILYKTLSRSNFFLCFPGVVMPLCHNVIEAMAFGAIPILPHAHHFHPALVHGKNCLAFQNEVTLREVVSRALQMTEDEISILRNNVIDYYNQHLSPKATFANLMNAKGRFQTLVMNAEYQSVRYLAQRQLK